jgi:predicted NAD/FAD-binding protein
LIDRDQPIQLVSGLMDHPNIAGPVSLTPLEKRRNIAIIGTGISGLGIAYLLHPHHNIKVYEKDDYIGGHSRTVDANTPDGKIAVDTGFIVFNKRNYPLLTALFSHLNVPVEESDMSFGASINNGWLEYGTMKAANLFVQKSNIFNLKFLQMVKDILKFNKKSHAYLECDPALTLGAYLDELKLGEWFRKYYLLAMGGAIWSTPIESMLEFPARTLIRFFENHGLLTLNQHPQWYTVKNGSKEYVKRLTASFSHNILLNCGVHKVIRNTDSVTVHDAKGNIEVYDEVIFACHADQALKMIENPSDAENAILSNFLYQPNRMVLHSDTSFMPKRKGAWASWVYLSEQQDDKNCHISLSYWMNNLQPLPTNTPIIATLNPSREPSKPLIYDEHWFEHPVFDVKAIQAQEKIDSIQGKDRFWFCGAYQRYGFHEDGLLSAVKIAEKMGIKPAWRPLHNAKNDF